MDIFSLELKTIDGDTDRLANYRNQVLLVVNVASQCGYTAQYTGLEALYRKHKGEGFSVLGFPCDQFGHQEPGKENEIKEFCIQIYGVTFPLFAKIEVNGSAAHPLFKYIKAQKKGLFGTEAIKWNFTKFLINRDGAVVKRYGSRVTPESIEKDIVGLLANTSE